MYTWLSKSGDYHIIGMVMSAITKADKYFVPIMNLSQVPQLLRYILAARFIGADWLSLRAAVLCEVRGLYMLAKILSQIFKIVVNGFVILPAQSRKVKCSDK